MRGFAFTLDDTQQFGVNRQISDDIVRLVTMMSLGKEIKSAIHHFDRDGCKRLIERTDRIDKSLFRLVLDWVRYALKRNLDLQPIFRFQPTLSTVNVR